MVLRLGDIAFGMAVAFLTGTLGASLGWNIFALSIVLLIMVVLISVLFFCVAPRTSMTVAAAILFSFFLGTFYFHLMANWRAATTQLPDKGSSFKVLVVDEPVVSEKYLTFSAKLQKPFNGDIKVFASPESRVSYGDLLDVSGSFIVPDTGGIPLFFPKKNFVISKGNGSWIVANLFELKRTIVQSFSRVLSGDEAALLGGLTLGGTSGMSAALKNEMAASETLYATAMYGYKIAMIGVIISGMLSGIMPRRWRSVVIAAVIFLFVLMSGANVSAVRAGVMVVIALVAEESGNIFSRRNALTFTAVGMVVHDPSVVAQAGFLFSFASLAGIFCLDAPLRKFLRIGEGNGFLEWKSAVILSVTSLLPLIPMISAVFGSFSLSAIAANILISPLIPVAFFCGCALAVSGFLLPFAAFFIAPFVRAMLVYQFGIIHFFAAHTIPLPFQFSTPISVLYYLFLGFFAYAYRNEDIHHSLKI